MIEFMTAGEVVEVLGYKNTNTVFATWANGVKKGSPPFDKYVDPETGGVRFGAESVRKYAVSRRQRLGTFPFDESRAVLVTTTATVGRPKKPAAA